MAKLGISEGRKVFVFPKISSHPYLELLYKNMAGIGVTCYDFRKIIDIINIFRSDIMHIHWIEFFIRSQKGLFSSLIKLYFYILFFLFMRYFLGKKIIITLHNIKPHETIHPGLEKFGFLFYLKIADAIIVHNKWSKREVSRIYRIREENVHIIPHGNFIGYYPDVISKEEARDKLKIPRDAFTILYFGKIKKYKGLNTLLSALKDLKKTDIWILICGKVEDEEIRKDLLDFRKKFMNSVLRLDYISDDEIQIYMNATDIGILPYEEITTSGTLLLFASFKRTVLVPDLRSIKEQAGKAAIYYTPGDAEDLKRAILESKNSNLDKMSEEMFQRALKYSWRDIAVKTDQLYQKVMKK